MLKSKVKEITCITCPKGCEIFVDIENNDIVDIREYGCLKGKEYAIQEIKSPVRNIATSVLVLNGEMPLVSVRLDKALSKELIFEVMKKIKEIKVTAPIYIGEVLIENICNSGVNVIATRNVSEK